VHHQTRSSVAAAFASERDASYAIRLFTSASDAEVRYTLRQVIGEDGALQMVILEATCADPALVSRLETAMEGAHGMIVPVEQLVAAKAS
jgi:hypothetical protein